MSSSAAVLAFAVPPEAGHRTKQQFVYQTLRDAIMRCDLRPGERLIIDDIAERLSVSAIPVREALQLLQSERLIVNVPHVGATVAPVSRKSIEDIFALLEGLETVATRMAATRAAAADIARLRAIVADMDAAVRAGDHERWGDLNTRFHMAICDISGLPLLCEMTERVLQEWGRVRRYYFRGQPRIAEAQREHHDLVKALAARKTARIVTLIRQHNRHALIAYMREVEEATP